MKDISGRAIEVGDIVVKGDRHGSGSGELHVYEVMRFDGARPVFRDKKKEFVFRGSQDLLVLPKSYSHLVGWSRW